MAHVPTGAQRAAMALLALFLGGEAHRAAAQAPPPATRAKKSVYGKLESVNVKLNGVFMKADDGNRLAWRFEAPVVAEVEKFKAGDPMIVIYRQITPTEKRVTAIAFPGSATIPTYVNMTGSRIVIRSAPFVAGACGQPNPEEIQQVTIPGGGTAEIAEACWCCASADESCTPGNKTGVGRALLVSCFE